MKSKRILSAVLAGLTAFGMVTALPDAGTVTASAAKKTQLEIMDIADSLYGMTWIAKKTIDSYGKDKDEIFYEGQEYHLPYGMPISKGMYIGLPSWGWVITPEKFLEEAKKSDSLLYTSNGGWLGSPYSNSAYCPYYGMDCSAFVSYCWNLSARNTTYGLPGYATNFGLVSETTIDKIELGDALNNSGHVVLVSDVCYDKDGKVIDVEITQETPPQLRRDVYTREELIEKYKTFYILQYAETDKSLASPKHEPYGVLNDIKGDVGGVKLNGWAYDVDAPKEAIDIEVWVGGDRGSKGAVCTTVKADTSSSDIKMIYSYRSGMNREHGMNKLVPVPGIQGKYEVFVYAVNKGKGSDVFLGSKKVDINPVNINDLRIDISQDLYLYDGKAKTPDVDVYYGSAELTQDVHYTAEYSDNTDIGTAKIKITGMSGYTGTVTKEFSIICSHEFEDTYKKDSEGRITAIQHSCPICGHEEEDRYVSDEETTNEEDIAVPDTVRRYDEMKDPTITGAVTGGRSSQGTVRLMKDFQVTLIDDKGKVYEAAVKGSNFKANVPLGYYTLRVSKNGCVTSEKKILINNFVTGVLVEINQLGDISKDGYIDVEDVVRVLFAINAQRPLSDYEALLADVNHDKKVDIIDVSTLMNHINGSKPLS